MKAARLGWATALCGTIAAAFPELLSPDRLLLDRDLFFLFVPLGHFVGQHLSRGRLPLWNPWTDSGTPCLGGLVAGALYPPSVLLALPFPLGWNLFLWAHYLLAAAGTWLFLRGRGLPQLAALLGGIAFSLGGPLVSLVGFTNHLRGAAWLPRGFVLFDRWLEKRNVAIPTALASVFALQWLGGSPEFAALTGIGLAGLSAFRLWRRPGELLGGALALAAAILLAGSWTAPQTLETLETLRASDRAGILPFEEASTWSLGLGSFLELLAPPAAAGRHWFSSLYPGIVVLVLAIAGVTGARERLFWLTLSGLAIALALGSNAPFYRWLYDALPGLFGRFRYPEKFYLLVHFSVAALAAEGAAALARRERRARAALAGASLGLAALLGVLSLFPGPGAQPLLLFHRSATILLVVGAIAAACHFGILREVAAKTLLVAALAADLIPAHRNLHVSERWSRLAELRPLVDLAQARQGNYRIFHFQTSSASLPGRPQRPIAGFAELDRLPVSRGDPASDLRQGWRALVAGVGMVYGVGAFSGGDPLGRRSTRLLLDTLRSLPRRQGVALLRVYSVGYLIGTSPLAEEGLEPLARETSSPFFAYRVTEAVPGAYLANPIAVAASETEALARILEPGFRPGRDVVVDRLPEAWKLESRSHAPGEASFLAYETDRVRVT
jgi:hypothetical protein